MIFIAADNCCPDALRKEEKHINLKERVYSVLLVSASDMFNKATLELLPSSLYDPVVVAGSISEAKRYIAERSFDFVIINSPLPDDSGTRFAIDCCHRPSTVALILARADVYGAVYDKVVEHGVFTLSKPISKTIMTTAMGWLASARERLRKTEQKSSSFEERMEEIRIVNRAKYLLISEEKMSEPDSHHYIEKYAMDKCISKRAAAEQIIEKYS